MKKDEILKILLDWNFWTTDQETGVERETYKKKLLELLETNFVVSVIGVRRSGKSTILRQVAKELCKKVGKENVLIVNFEDRRFTKPDLRVLDRVFEVYVEEIGPTGKPFVFLDEVHRVDGWEKWVRTFHELKKAKIVVSGSTSQLIRGELSTLLTGRHLDLNVFPLNFKEFLKFRNLELKTGLDVLENETRIKSLLKEYLVWGGYPEVVLTERFRKEILQNYFEDIVTRDIVERYGVRKIEEMKTLAKFYLSNTGKYTTFSSVKKFLELSKDTIEKFSTYFQEVFMIFFLKMFDYSLKNQEIVPRKIYCIDNGLVSAMGFRVSEDRGRLMENLVYLELMKKSGEVFYWKEYGRAEGREVDFLVRDGLRVKRLIQVTYAAGRDEVEPREIRSLVKAAELFKKDRPELSVITWDYEAVEEIGRKKIKFIPLWRWLLTGEVGD